MSDTDGPTLAVDVEEATTPVTAGDTLTVTVTVTNTGDNGEATVRLLADGEETASTDVELDADGEQTVELEWETTNDDVGEHECTVETDDDSDAVAVTVEDAPASFDVEITSAPAHITSGQSITVVATVTNTGTLEGTQSSTFSVDDETQETVSDVTLASEQSEEFEFTYGTTDSEDAPDVAVAVASEDDTANQTVPVVTTSVTRLREMGSKSGMSLFGYLMFFGMIILLIPLLPFILLIRLVNFLADEDRPVR